MDYAIIKVGNKQHRVRDGETLVVERVATEEGKTFEPVVLLGDEKVTATVVAHERGPKIIIGKYKRRTGYKRHNGFRAAISRVEITIGAGTKRAATKRKRAPKAEPVETPEGVEVVETAPVGVVPVEGAPIEDPSREASSAEDEGAPSGYDSMTVARINAATKEWSEPELEAALSYERSHGARKGAITALEAALAKDAAGEDEPAEQDAPASDEES
jgi:large subunit ribosomal protein L21